MLTGPAGEMSEGGVNKGLGSPARQERLERFLDLPSLRALRTQLSVGVLKGMQGRGVTSFSEHQLSVLQGAFSPMIITHITILQNRIFPLSYMRNVRLRNKKSFA